MNCTLIDIAQFSDVVLTDVFVNIFDLKPVRVKIVFHNSIVNSITMIPQIEKSNKYVYKDYD